MALNKVTEIETSASLFMSIHVCLFIHLSIIQTMDMEKICYFNKRQHLISARSPDLVIVKKKKKI